MFVWQAHKGKVRSLAFSPDGGLVATTSGTSRLVSLWDPATGQLVRKLDPGTRDRGTLAVGFAPGAPLFAASMTESVRIWDTRTWEPLTLLHAREAWAGNGYEVAFGPGPAPRLAVGEARIVRVWENAAEPTDAAPRPEAFSFRVENVPSLDISPDGSLIAANVLPSATLHDAANGQLVRQLEHPHSKHHGPIKFSPDGTRIAHAYNRTVLVEPVEPGAGRADPIVCKGHTGLVWAIGWSADGRTLLTAAADGTTRLWDPDTGAERRSFDWGVGKLLAASFAPDGMTAVAAGEEGKVVVWDLDG